MGVFDKFRYFNLRLGLSVLLIAISSFNYGFDNQAFALTQAMDAFDRNFGVYNEKTQTWSLETYWLSLFNSLNYIGFAAGMTDALRSGRSLTSLSTRRDDWEHSICAMGTKMVYVLHELLCSHYCYHCCHLKQQRADYGSSDSKLYLHRHGTFSRASLSIRNRCALTLKPI